MLSKEVIILQLKEYFSSQAEKYRIDLAFLFGSFARGRVKEESDVDVAVIFSRDVSKEDEIFKLVTVISAELNALIKLEINVIPILSDFRKPMLYYNAVVLGVPVYVGNRHRFVQIYNQALFEMNDFELFGSRFQLEAARRNLKEARHG